MNAPWNRSLGAKVVWFLTQLESDSRPRKMCDIRAEHGERNRAALLEAIRGGLIIAEACQAATWTDI